MTKVDRMLYTAKAHTPAGAPAGRGPMTVYWM